MLRFNQFVAISALLTALIIVCSHASALQASRPTADSWAEFQSQVSAQTDPAATRAAEFLIAHHPQRDASIDSQLLSENLEFAIKARQSFPWAKSLSEDLFLNDVLPYAVLDETREHWRPQLFELSSEIVKGTSNATDAAQALNRELFKKVNVRYSTARAKANQSPLETMQSGLASCTGLSILLVDACRSVGIPARIAGIASWMDREGNHAWVEIWDGHQWRFTGAAEYDSNGLDRGWFTGPASLAIKGHELHGVWATSWKSTGDYFPLVWDLNDRSIPAVDVTSRYAKDHAENSGTHIIALRLWASRNGTRIAAPVKMISVLGVFDSKTFADPDDIN
ncbi:MAG TPA: transglutaminase-like domain-containing protein, partial [Phycisphaerales bacterium]|nr:transglutaminase-like domain-containing protein [Phycisphaerales bacterium]